MLVLKPHRASPARCFQATMFSAKRAAPFLSITAFILTLLYLRLRDSSPRWRHIPPILGEGSFVPEQKAIVASTHLSSSPSSNKPLFAPGTPKPPGSNYTRALIMPRTSTEDVSWIDSEKLDVIKAIYAVEDANADLRVPANKGHEAMVYLSYIIDHYTVLPDISIFMHAHQYAWHNAELLNGDAAEMVRRLSSERVVREGFVNLRCNWNPGCPDWMHPGVVEEEVVRPEETLMVQCWAELFPGAAVPTRLAQPCCAQFAASRERIRAVPRATWLFYRDWLLKTELNDLVSGRIWEYLWQVALTGEAFVCRDPHECYCDGYGICFEDDKDFEGFNDMWNQRGEWQGELDGHVARVKAWDEFRDTAVLPVGVVDMEEPEEGKEQALRAKIENLNREMQEWRSKAVERGAMASVRAQVAGREWQVGDGF